MSPCTRPASSFSRGMSAFNFVPKSPKERKEKRNPKCFFFFCFCLSVILYYNPGYHHVRNAHVKIWDPKKKRKEKRERIFIERVENGLVLTTDWFNDNKKREKILIGSGFFFYEKNSESYTTHPAHKYCVYWTIFCNPTRSFHTRTHTHTQTHEKCNRRKKENLEAVWFVSSNRSPPPICLYDVISPTMMGLCLFHTWASGGVRRRPQTGHDLCMYTCAGSTVVSRPEFPGCLSPSSSTSLSLSLNSVHKYNVTSYNKQRSLGHLSVRKGKSHLTGDSSRPLVKWRKIEKKKLNE